MSASCSARTIALNSCTCPPGVALLLYLGSGAKNPMVL